MRFFKLKIIFLFLFSILPLNVSAKNKNINCNNNLFNLFPINIKDKYCLNKNNYLALENNISINHSNNFSNFLNQKKYDIFAEMPLIKSNTTDDNKITVDIRSDVQSENEGQFLAEGNVELKSNNGTLYADKIVFDREKEVFKAYGNVKIIRGNTYLESQSLEYDFLNKKGIIKKAYGLVDINSINQDLDLNQKVQKTDLEIYKQQIRNLTLTDESNLGISDEYTKNRSLKLEFSLSDVSKWRYKSEEINFTSSSLSSKEIFFTNDAYNDPQFIIQSKNFSGETINDKLRINSKSSFLILDNRLKLPIGNRTIHDKDPITKWGFGSDYSDKDGIFFYRGFNSLELNNNLSLEITPYFLIQRALIGETKAFIPKNNSILSEKEKDNTNISDYFAADVKIKGNINNWDIMFENNLNTLNTNRSHDFLRSNLVLKNNLYYKDFNNNENNFKNPNFNLLNSEDYFSEELNLELFSTFRKTVWRGLDGQDEIYFAYGTRLNKNNFWIIDKTTHNTYLNAEIGSFKAKNTSNELIERQRAVLNGSYGIKYEIWSPKNLDERIDQTYKYSPSVIQQGLFLKNKLSFSLFEYNEGKSQQALEFKLGPEFIFGQKKKKVFDYTRFKTEYTYILRSGQSPFVFDSVNKSAYANFEFDQQIYGPFKFKYKTTLNLDGESNNYGEFSNNRYELSFNRRAYLLNAFIDPEQERFGINFKIFNFGYLGGNTEF